MSIQIRHAVALAAVAAAAALATALATAGPAAADPAPPTTTTDPAVAAAGWLAQQFQGADHKASPTGDHFDGSYPQGASTVYYFDGGTTADAVFALAAARVGRAKIDAAVSYFQKHVTDYTSSGDGQVAKAALAAIVAGADPTHFGTQDLLADLKHDECTAVSDPNATDPPDYSVPLCPAIGAGQNIYSSVSESLIILAEARAGGADAPSAAAISYFLSLQCPGGGFTSLTAACTKDSDASVDETAYAAMALAALGGHGAELDRTNAWLTGQRTSGGYWNVQGGPDVDSTALAAAALEAAGQDVTKSRAWLVTQQVSTGPTIGAGAARGALRFQGTYDPTASVKATADGILGLAEDASLATLTATGAAQSVPVLALAPATARTASVNAGGTQTVTATGFSAGESVSGVLHSAPVAIGRAKASPAGTVTLSFTVPTTLAPGSHTVVLTGATSGLSTVSAPFTVTEAPTPPSTTPTAPSTPASPGTQDGAAGPNNCDSAALACTGRDGRQTRGEVVLGLGLLVAGAGAVYVGRRRRA